MFWEHSGVRRLRSWSDSNCSSWRLFLSPVLCILVSSVSKMFHLLPWKRLWSGYTGGVGVWEVCADHSIQRSYVSPASSPRMSPPPLVVVLKLSWSQGGLFSGQYLFLRPLLLIAAYVLSSCHLFSILIIFLKKLLNFLFLDFFSFICSLGFSSFSFQLRRRKEKWIGFISHI